MMIRFGICAIGLAILAGCKSAPKTELPPEKETVQNAIQSHVGDVSDCYTAALKKNPRLSGKLVLEWEINPIGDPKNVKVIQPVEPKLDQCIVKKLSGWAFPAPPDNKIAKVKYPFVFQPAAEATAAVTTKQFETVATAPANNFKKCPELESEYAGLCVRDENSGECVLDAKQFGEILQLMRKSPKLEMTYLAEVDRLLKNPKPTQKDADDIAKYLAEDCWTPIHMRMWTSIFHTVKTMPTSSRIAEAKEVLGQRTSALEVHSPTLLTLSQDLAILKNAIDSGFIKPGPQAKKDFDTIYSQTKALRATVVKDWTGKAPADDEVPETSPIAADPTKIVKLVRKELKAVKPLRARLKDWSKRYWKKF